MSKTSFSDWKQLSVVEGFRVPPRARLQITFRVDGTAHFYGKHGDERVFLATVHEGEEEIILSGPQGTMLEVVQTGGSVWYKTANVDQSLVSEGHSLTVLERNRTLNTDYARLERLVKLNEQERERRLASEIDRLRKAYDEKPPAPLKKHAKNSRKDKSKGDSAGVSDAAASAKEETAADE